MLTALVMAVLVSLAFQTVAWASVAIFGSVLSRETGEPLSKATVSADVHVDVYKQLTNARGGYLIDLPAGSGYTITVSALGYKSQTRSNVDLPNNTVRAEDFRLAPEDKPGPYTDPIASIDIDQTNDWVYVWNKDGTVTYGTPLDLDRYSSAPTLTGISPTKSYSVP